VACQLSTAATGRAKASRPRQKSAAKAPGRIPCSTNHQKWESKLAYPIWADDQTSHSNSYVRWCSGYKPGQHFPGPGSNPGNWFHVRWPLKAHFNFEALRMLDTNVKWLGKQMLRTGRQRLPFVCAQNTQSLSLSGSSRKSQSNPLLCCHTLQGKTLTLQTWTEKSATRPWRLSA